MIRCEKCCCCHAGALAAAALTAESVVFGTRQIGEEIPLVRPTIFVIVAGLAMGEDGVTVCMQDPLDDCLEEFLASSTCFSTLPPADGGGGAAVGLQLLGCPGPRLLLTAASSACCAWDVITADLLGVR